MSESTQRREYMLLSIRHLRSIAPRGSRNKIRNPKLEIRTPRAVLRINLYHRGAKCARGNLFNRIL
jgi:hypothetical protein